jgi:hypothetical protein
MRKEVIYSAKRQPTFVDRTRDPESRVVRAQLYLPHLPVRPAGSGKSLFRLENIVYTEYNDLDPGVRAATLID